MQSGLAEIVPAPAPAHGPDRHVGANSPALLDSSLYPAVRHEIFLLRFHVEIRPGRQPGQEGGGEASGGGEGGGEGGGVINGHLLSTVHAQSLPLSKALALASSSNMIPTTGVSSPISVSRSAFISTVRALMAAVDESSSIAPLQVAALHQHCTTAPLHHYMTAALHTSSTARLHTCNTARLQHCTARDCSTARLQHSQCAYMNALHRLRHTALLCAPWVWMRCHLPLQRSWFQIISSLRVHNAQK